MIQRFKLATLFFALALCLGAWCGYTTAVGQAGQPSSSVQQPIPLTAQERRGRIIYLRGESAAGREIVATVGELDVPSTTVACAGCHGRKGEGKTEGGVSAGNLTWANLTKTYGHTHPTGRKHGPFNDPSFIMAVANGVDPNRNRLLAAMPRYRMAPEDMADLLAYLKRIEFDQDPGLSAESIEVGVVLPTTGPLREVGAAMHEMLAAYFEDLNSRGGIYNRKIKLHFTEGGEGNMSSAFASARTLARQGQAFAFVGGLSAGADKELAAVGSDEEVPFVGPATLLPETGKPPNRYLFYLLPGAAEQARALINFADSRLGLKHAQVAILYPEGLLTRAAATAASEQAQLRGWEAVVDKPIVANSFDAMKLAQVLKEQHTEAVFFFGDGAQTISLLEAAKVLDWTPNVFLIGTFASKDITNTLPAVFKGKIFLAFPTVPADITADGAAEYRALLEKYKLTRRHTASQITALAAAKTFVEGLKRAGADLSREQLISALEGIYDFDTGLTPRLIFGPNRRVGAAGAYMVTINFETKEFAAASGWVPAN